MKRSKSVVPAYYWDTSIFTMVLKGETVHGEGVLEAAVSILRMTEQLQAQIISSEIVVAEVLPCKTASYDIFEAWLQWPNITLRGVDHPIAMRASKLRNDYFNASLKDGGKLNIEDAVHIATAMIYEDDIEEIHSVDGDFPKALKRAKESLIAVKPHKIDVPMTVQQTTLDSEWGDEDLEE